MPPEGPASADARERHDRAYREAVQAQGIDRVFRTGRQIAALAPHERRERVAIELHQEDSEPRRERRRRLGLVARIILARIMV